MNDELAKKNVALTENLNSANETISTQVAKNDTLTKQNIDLGEKVAIGSILKVSGAKILAMREKTNGQLTETSRSRNTDAFRVNFTIGDNAIAEQGERHVYIQIKDAAGNTLGNAGKLTLLDGVEITYSDRTIVNYMNKSVDIISLVEVNRDTLNEGAYTVNIYIGELLSGVASITLK
jgi:hypothetical protein